MEVGLDPRRLRILGQPRAVRDDVMQAVFMPNSYLETGGAQVAVSRSGNLAYVRGGTFPELPLAVMRVLPNGEATRLDWDPHGYVRVRASPRGDRVGYSAGPGNLGSIYVRDLTSGTTLRLNTGGVANPTLEWSPDGKSIAFTSDRDGPVANIYRMPSDGSGVPERLAPANHMQHVASWSSAGVIAFLQQTAGQFDIWTIVPGGKPVPFVTSSANETDATFSPDGRWLAYASDQTGRNEVYVRPYPGPAPRFRFRVAAGDPRCGPRTGIGSTISNPDRRVAGDDGRRRAAGRPVSRRARDHPDRCLALHRGVADQEPRHSPGRLVHRYRSHAAGRWSCTGGPIRAPISLSRAGDPRRPALLQRTRWKDAMSGAHGLGDLPTGDRRRR